MEWIVLPFLFVCFLGLIPFLCKLADFHRKRFVAGKPKMSDEEFCRKLGLEGIDCDIALWLRKDIAERISVSKELLHPDDPMRKIKACYWFDWEHEATYMAIEDFFSKRSEEVFISLDFMTRLHEVGCLNKSAKLADYIKTAVTEYQAYIENGKCGKNSKFEYKL